LYTQLVLILSLVAVTQPSFSQLRKLTEFELEGITHVSVDRLGNFYFVVENGSIKKYDPSGKLMASSLPQSHPLSLLEAWNPLRVFAYYAEDTAYHIFDYNLELLEIKKLNPALAIAPQLVCPGNEPAFWIFDKADNSVKKFDYRTSELLIESSIDSAGAENNYSFMREYQNYLFLANQDAGIEIYNSLGKPVNQIPLEGVSYFNFMGEELCYRKSNQLLLYDLYTAEVRTIAQLDERDNIRFSITTDERVVVVVYNKVMIYSLTL
jgi:hypothetical protein